MPNRLANETSPYLLQHKDNPVDWFPWGGEALGRSRDEDKPIFLSIGYSACHWCHVMEHESFEHTGIAKFLNDHFVCIKVDREERPDIDQIYMNAVQVMTGHGGWPMSMFLLPDLRPFYGGTYWPPHAGRGMPGFDQVLQAVIEAFRERRDQCEMGAQQITDQITSAVAEHIASSDVLLSERTLVAAGQGLERSFDNAFGGFGDAPKFPHPMALQHLLRLHQRTGSENWLGIVRLTLDRMAAGGIYDHLGGGFARYSVDERWLVPHFEKMLYDNALLASVYTEAWQVTGDESYARVSRETLDYILRDMTDPAGGFYSAEDADSEGHEGLFYTWTPAEIASVLGSERAEQFCRVYGVSDGGNFEGRSILHLAKSVAQCARLWNWDEAKLHEELGRSRQELLAVRATRVRPGRDDKVLVSWNGLAIDALARAGAALDEQQYVDAAARAADFILTQMRDQHGRLYHTWRAGEAKLTGYLDDYVTLANGLASLYQATFDSRWVSSACELMDIVLTHFRVPGEAGLFFTADDHEELILRSRDYTDNATPNGNALAATALLRLAALTGRQDYEAAARGILEQAAELLSRIPHGMGQMLLALDLAVGPLEHWVLVGPGATSVGQNLNCRFSPRRLLLCSDATPSGLDPCGTWLADRPAVDGQLTLYRCVGNVCDAPVSGRAAIDIQIKT